MPAEWNLGIARKMRENGMAYHYIADHFGIASTTVRARLNPEYAESHREASRECNRRRRETDRQARAHMGEVTEAKRKAGVKQVRSHVRALVDDAEAMRQLAALPRDTRSLTARIAGDPLPGRSALDMRNASAG